MTTELKQIRIERSVGNSLTNAAFDLLPDELRNDYSVSWLREFAEFRDKHYDHRDEYGFEDRTEFYFVLDMLQKTVSDNIKFYSAVLFHIGRRLKIAEIVDGKIAAALQPEHLQQTFEANRVLSNNNDQSVAIGLVQETLKEASRVHKIIAQQQWSLWQIWKKEIVQFQEAFQDTSEKLHGAVHNRHDRHLGYLYQAPARLMRDSFRHKELAKRMDELGFRVDVGDYENDPQTLVLLQLLSMDNYEIREKLELIKQHNISRGLDADALERMRNQEISTHIQKQLVSEFGDNDPFAGYEPLRKLPDITLYTLYNKCILPDRSKFYYAERWLKTIEEQYYYYYEYKIPQFKSELTVDDIHSYARNADSAIKKDWVEGNANMPGTSEQRMQYSFEKKWIESFVIAIRYGDKNFNNDWTLAVVIKLIADVVKYMNELGYKLFSPDHKRLEKLWNEAKNTYYSIDW